MPDEASTSSFQLRFRTNSSIGNELAYVDDVQILGTPAQELAMLPLSTVGVGMYADRTMHVDSILVSSVEVSKGVKKGQVSTVVVDNYGEPISGAIVTGTFSGDINERAIALTDQNGLALFLTTGTTTSRCHLGFTVSDVGHYVLYYSPSQNVVTTAYNY